MSGFVYFIQNVSGEGPVKIGYSADPKSRLATLRTASAADLCLIGVVKGDRRQEAALHDLFSAHRLHGEWFEMHDALAAFIAAAEPLELDDAPVMNAAQFIRDWGIGQFAADLDIPYFHANAMLRRNSIPVEYWRQVIAASVARGTPMDANDLLAMVQRIPAAVSRRAAA